MPITDIELSARRKHWSELLQLYDFDARYVRNFQRYFDWFADEGIAAVPALPGANAAETKAMFDRLLADGGVERAAGAARSASPSPTS